MKQILKFFRTLFLLGLFFCIAKMVKILLDFKQKNGKTIIFNGLDESFRDEPPQETDYNLLFSGLNFDFTNLENPPEELELNFDGMFCGINIKIPEEWNVELSGVEAKSQINNPAEKTEDAPTILKIKYDLKYSGMNIKPK